MNDQNDEELVTSLAAKVVVNNNGEIVIVGGDKIGFWTFGKCDDDTYLLAKKSIERVLREAIRITRDRTREEDAMLVESRLPQLRQAEVKSRFAGREGVANCRQSDIDTREEIAKSLRAMQQKGTK